MSVFVMPIKLVEMIEKIQRNSFGIEVTKRVLTSLDGDIVSSSKDHGGSGLETSRTVTIPFWGSGCGDYPYDTEMLFTVRFPLPKCNNL